MAKVGYARVSSTGQSLDVQLEKLNHCAKERNQEKLKQYKTFKSGANTIYTTAM